MKLTFKIAALLLVLTTVLPIFFACSYGGKNIPVIFTPYTTVELSKAIGIKAAVISLDDEGFAKAAADKYTNDSGRKD